MPSSLDHQKGKIIFFDDECMLCNRFIQYILKKDKKREFFFASLNSKYMDAVLKTNPELKGTDSIILFKRGNLYTESTAALKIAKELGGFISLSYAFMIIPKPIRDLFYRIIAKNRYKWFGTTTCMIPDEEQKKQFL